jgi:hypothetical protein
LLVRQLTRPGVRVALPFPIGPLDHLPAKVSVGHFSASFETEPNRFVRMAFEKRCGANVPPDLSNEVCGRSMR